MNREFSFNRDTFLKDGDPYRIISGSIHYFRSFHNKWDMLLEKLASLGCNSISTFVPWNLHEPEEGKFDFSDNRDLKLFIQKAGQQGLNVILRPGPYVCGELDCGGIPAWVFEETNSQIRCSNHAFQQSVENYITKLSEIITPLTYPNGGPVIMIQIENEYGTYGNDRKYLNFLKQLFSEKFPGIVLYTSDQPKEEYLRAGRIDGTLSATFLGSRAKERLNYLDKMGFEGPKFCAEFWSGWHNTWGSNHHVRSTDSTASTLDEILSSGASVNIYMFHGGTNYGFTAGAYWSEEGGYKPVTTSYDYDALLTEAGDVTQKYIECRKVISKYTTLPAFEKYTGEEIFEKKNITFPKRSTLFHTLQYISTPVYSVATMTMEELNLTSGMVLYRTKVEGPIEDGVLKIDGLHDWAQIFINEVYHNTISRLDGEKSVVIDIPDEGAVLDILVENLGRISIGPKISEKKGITRGVLLNNRMLFNWEIFPIDFAHPESIPFQLDSTYEPEKVPSFYFANFSIDRERDTYIDMSDWKKGIVYVNNVNLGRYWEIGPQQTLYLPSSVLRKGKNSLIIFEHYEVEDLSIEFVKKPFFGKKSHIKKSLLSRFFNRTE
jgi:beta-galactosidase